MTANGYQISCWGDENILKLTAVMAEQLEYTKNHSIVHFKWVNCRLCKLYLKAVKNSIEAHDL